MKVRFLKNWVGEVEKKRLQEVWDVSYSKWTELTVEDLKTDGESADLVTYEGDTVLAVPLDAFQKI